MLIAAAKRASQSVCGDVPDLDCLAYGTHQVSGRGDTVNDHLCRR